MNCEDLNSNTVYIYIQTYQLGKNYMIRALDSIRNQTYSNFRCIIYDNCSDNEVRNILQNYVKDDRRFSLTYFDEMKGHVIVREYGIPEILHLAGDRGGFFFRVDADDELEPDCLKKMVEYMKKNDLDMAVSGATFIVAETMEVLGVRNVQTNVILEGDLFERKFPEYYQIMRTHWGKLYKIDVIKRMNLSNIYILPYGSDTLFVREALLKSKKVGILQETLYKYYLYSDTKTYNMKEGRANSPGALLERDFSFIMQKCGYISSNTIEWLINVYLCENEDVFKLIVNDQKESQKKVEDIYSVLSSIPCRMAMRLGARGKYTKLCKWLLHQNILENEQTFCKCAEIFGILCVVPNHIPEGGDAEHFRFLVKLYDFWDDYDSKSKVEEKILDCVRKNPLLQNCDFYYCRFNADIVETLLKENYADAYKRIKEAIQKKDYFENQFVRKNVELGQNIAAILQDENEYVYMSKRKMEVLVEESLDEASMEVDEWLKLLPNDDELIELKQRIIEKR